MSGCLDVWMSGCLDVWMSGCLDCWIAGLLDCWIQPLLGDADMPIFGGDVAENSLPAQAKKSITNNTRLSFQYFPPTLLIQKSKFKN